MLNIPKYRAKKIDSDEYVQGHLIHEMIKVSNNGEKDTYLDIDDYAITSQSGYNYDVVDPETLSIHFPDMLDTNKKQIFASLREDGKGSDLIEDDTDTKYYCYYEQGAFYLKNISYDTLDDELAIPLNGLKIKGLYNENK